MVPLTQGKNNLLALEFIRHIGLPIGFDRGESSGDLFNGLNVHSREAKLQ